MTMSTILVPTDFTPCSQLAIALACELAEKLHAEIHMVHIQYGSQDTDTQRHAMDRLLAATPPAYELQNKVHREVLHGNVCDELVKYATVIKADFIVMGTQGRTGIAQLTHGSVAKRLLKESPCPVLIVKQDMQPIEGMQDESSEKYEQLKASDSPALDLLARAVSLRASDIHIDPLDDEQYSVRFRIDGRIATYCTVDRTVGAHLMHQYLTLAKIDQADPFRPREGRLELPATMREIETRVTATPVAGGEAMALRLFSKENLYLPLENLGLHSKGLETIQQMLHGTEGLLLVTGPTGSGKTTTVYSMLNCFAGESRNIVSIEDPVEFDVPFVRQLNVDERHDVTMATGLSTLLRMDPDVIFVGEIRDPETGRIALRCASSGRFVFSSLHTRDVAATLTTLRDLGITNHSVSANLIGVVNQRLVRRLCLKCRKAVEPSPACRDSFLDSGLPVPAEVFEPAGCDACRGTGYRGRSGVFECVSMDAELSKAIADNATEAELRRMIRSRGIASLAVDALDKVQSGVTDYQEAISVTWI